MMKGSNNQANGIHIAYIGGGSRGWAWGLMSDFALEKSISGKIYLYDIDFDAAKANEIIGNKLFSREEYKDRWQFEAVDSLEKALTGADFVVLSILPGTFDEMEYDVHAPEKYGIYQSVGDTIGPGGLIRALRTVPMYEVIGRAIRDYAPRAWVINYTNPMTICVKTLYEVFPDIKVIGCCHEVFGTEKLLVEAAKKYLGYPDTLRREDIEVSVIGINHFTWLNYASVNGDDLFPAYARLASEYAESGFNPAGEDNWLNSYFECSNRVKFDLFNRFGLIAAAGDRHLAEFVPGDWYMKDPETVKQWKYSLTPVSWRKEFQRRKKKEESRMLVSGEKEFEVKPTGEDGVKIIRALCGLEDLIINVNVRNQGQVSGIPLGCVVETNALIRRDSVLPIYAGQLPPELNGMVNRHANVQNAIVKAAMARDLEMAYRVFINENRMNLSLKDSRELFDTMVEGTRAYLGEYK